jgi:hypothetical protein
MQIDHGRGVPRPKNRPAARCTETIAITWSLPYFRFLVRLRSGGRSNSRLLQSFDVLSPVSKTGNYWLQKEKKRKKLPQTLRKMPLLPDAQGIGGARSVLCAARRKEWSGHAEPRKARFPARRAGNAPELTSGLIENMGRGLVFPGEDEIPERTGAGFVALVDEQGVPGDAAAFAGVGFEPVVL